LKDRFSVAAALVFVAAAVLLGAAVFHHWPINLDETFRLEEAAQWLRAQRGEAPVLLSPTFGFMATLTPIAAFVPGPMHPLVGRAIGLFGLAIALIALRSVLRKMFPADARNGWLMAGALFFASPATLCKMSELRPDAFAAAFVLLGGVKFLLDEKPNGQWLGLALIGLATTLRIESVLALVPLGAIILWEVIQRRQRAVRLVALAIPVLVYAGLCFLLYPRDFPRILLDLRIMRYMFAGEGSLASIAWYWAALAPLAIAAVAGAVFLAATTFQRDGGRERAAAFWVLTSAILFFLFHLLTDTLYHQDLWSQIYFLVPFAGVYAARSIWLRRAESLAHRALALIVALWCLNTMMAVFPFQVGAIPPPKLACADESNRFPREPKALADFPKDQINYQQYSPVEMAAFFSWTAKHVGPAPRFFSNDFILPFGAKVPPHPAGNVESIFHWNRQLRTTLQGTFAERETRRRLPAALFPIDGVPQELATYVWRSQPDLLVFDHYLALLACLEPGLRAALAADYSLVIADGHVPVFIRSVAQVL
jgi:hypothetical protein